MQVSFSGIYKVNVITNKKTRKNADFFRQNLSDLLNNNKNANGVYQPKEKSDILEFMSNAMLDYTVPVKDNKSLNDPRAGATLFTLANDTYIATGKDHANLNKITKKLDRNHASKFDYKQIYKGFIKETNNHNTMGEIYIGSKKGKRADIFTVHRAMNGINPFNDEEHGYQNSGLIL